MALPRTLSQTTQRTSSPHNLSLQGNTPTRWQIRPGVLRASRQAGALENKRVDMDSVKPHPASNVQDSDNIKSPPLARNYKDELERYDERFTPPPARFPYQSGSYPTPALLKHRNQITLPIQDPALPHLPQQYRPRRRRRLPLLLLPCRRIDLGKWASVYYKSPPQSMTRPPRDSPPTSTTARTTKNARISLLTNGKFYAIHPIAHPQKPEHTAKITP